MHQQFISGTIGAAILGALGAIYKWGIPWVVEWFRGVPTHRERREGDLQAHIAACRERHAKVDARMDSHDISLAAGNAKFQRQEDATERILNSLGKVEGKIDTVISLLPSYRKD